MGKKKKKVKSFYSKKEDKSYLPHNLANLGKGQKKEVQAFVQAAYQELAEKQKSKELHGTSEEFSQYCYQHDNIKYAEDGQYLYDEEALKALRFHPTDTSTMRVYDYYKEYGCPDMRQNWLELFTSDVINDIESLLHYGSDNQVKADLLIEELETLEFYCIGEGTNILVMGNLRYPGVVFKIALDEYGIADNTNDYILQYQVPRVAKVYAVHPSGLVSVQQRYYTVRTPLLRAFPIIREKIIALLDEISKDFLIIDLCPDLFFLNYGIAPDGEFVFIDASDLYPLDQVKMKDGKFHCTSPVKADPKTGKTIRCEGKLEYTENYSKLICKKCGCEYNPKELRAEKEGFDMLGWGQDSSTKKLRREREEEEVQRILEARGESADTKEKEEHINNVMVDGFTDDAEEETSQQSQDESIDSQHVPLSPQEEDEDEIEEIPENISKMFKLMAEFSAGKIDKATAASIYNEITSNAVVTDDSEELSDDEEDGPRVIMVDEEEDESDDAIEQEQIVVDIHNPEPEEETDEEDDDTDPAEAEYPEDEDDVYIEVINEDGSKRDRSRSPGIYVEVQGDFSTAWDSFGVPIYLKIDEEEYVQVITKGELGEFMEENYTILKD